MTKYLTALRILMVCAFFINITALFLTHYGLNKFPCEPVEVLQENEWICIGEMNPIADNLIQSGGFVGHFSAMVVVWGVMFLWWERRIVRKAVWNRFAWIPAIGVTFLLSIDLFNDIFVLMDTVKVASGL